MVSNEDIISFNHSQIDKLTACLGYSELLKEFEKPNDDFKYFLKSLTEELKNSIVQIRTFERSLQKGSE